MILSVPAPQTRPVGDTLNTATFKNEILVRVIMSRHLLCPDTSNLRDQYAAMLASWYGGFSQADLAKLRPNNSQKFYVLHS